MTSQQLYKKIAQLEFEHDQLLAELQHIDGLLRSVGFPEGLQSIKLTAEELLHNQEEGLFES